MEPSEHLRCLQQSCLQPLLTAAVGLLSSCKKATISLCCVCLFHSRHAELPLRKNKSKGEVRSGSVDSSDRDQVPSQAMGFLRRGYLNRTLLWLIGDRVTPWTSDLYLSLESDSEGQWDEMLKGWNAIPTSLAPSPLYGCCRDLQVLLLWLLFMFSASSANHGFINLLQNQLFSTTRCFLPLSVWKSNCIAASLVHAGFGSFHLLPSSINTGLFWPKQVSHGGQCFFEWLVTSAYLPQ